MGKTVDYESRRKAILEATINRYIETGLPVASEDIAKFFDLSSASVRNILAELEEAGYLTHPYTSGGRMPTHKGYRYYVDFLIFQMELYEEEKQSIAKEYRKEEAKLEDLLEQTSELISGVTHCAGIASVMDGEGRFVYRGLSQVLHQPEFNDLSRIRLLIKTLEEKELLLAIINREFQDKVKIYIGEEMGCPEIPDCSLVVSTYHVKNKPRGRIAVLGPVRMQYKHTIPAVEYISEVLTQILSSL